ncbi:MAG: type II secretion system protein GspG [Candidatus Sumerlaeaceae bacterium]|nr:type II secretion system protein GspG [Candidatus Sumerlaeaceae bacterium]
MGKRAFTLIELLIVVAIIAILAAIAVPNFLEAQTRAKVSRAKADIRSTATALEAYCVDTNKYPFDITALNGSDPGTSYFWYVSNRITTPIAYMSSNNFLDPFREKRSTLPDLYKRFRFISYDWRALNLANSAINATCSTAYQNGVALWGRWRLNSSGPDAIAGPWSPLSTWSGNADTFPNVVMLYDPTNGSISGGDIMRSQASSEPRQGDVVP